MLPVTTVQCVPHARLLAQRPVEGFLSPWPLQSMVIQTQTQVFRNIRHGDSKCEI